MPNIKAMTAQDALAQMAQEDRLNTSQAIKRKQDVVSDCETIADMFRHPGWEVLCKRLQTSLAALEAEFYTEAPVSNEVLQNLRAQMIYLNRVLHLDTEISNTLQLQQDEIKALSAKLADGQA